MEEEQTMKQKEKPASKIPTTQTNTNRKKRRKAGPVPGVSARRCSKNETTLIIAGALVVTLLVFFVFLGLRGPGPKP